MYPRPAHVRHVGGHTLVLTFEDGIEAELDFAQLPLLGGAFKSLRDPNLFAQARIDLEAQTLVWPGGQDVCPDVLYHLATNVPLPGAVPHPFARLVRLRRPSSRAAG